MSNFGEDFILNWPLDSPPRTKFFQTQLSSCVNVEKSIPLSLKELVDNSSQFPVKVSLFPIETCCIKSQPKDRQSRIEEEAASAYPIIHERVLWLYLRFLEHKLQYGTAIEKNVYKGMTITQFVQRLLTKRCVSFLGRNDTFLLLSGVTGNGGFEAIGTDEEKHPLTLENCLSYDEIKLSALLSVSSYTDFINDGVRSNKGIVEKNKSKIEIEGVIIGIIGARFEVDELMEYQDIIITQKQNNPAKGYGTLTDNSNLRQTQLYDFRQMWSAFYEESNVLYDQFSRNDKRFQENNLKNEYFDNIVMKKRYTISFDTLLLESQARAAECNKLAYIHVVGIGLGVWKANKNQEKIFLEVFAQRIKYQMDKLSHICYIHFSWFSPWGEIQNNAFMKADKSEHPKGGIKIYVSNRNPSEKLKNVGENVLLVVSYAWDGNAFPGNEFWLKKLSSTGDPAAACSSLITELHNPLINKTMVSGNNLHIAALTTGQVLHISDFAKSIGN